MIDGLIDQLSATLSTTPRIIATGGMSKTIVPHCRHQITIDPYLLFKGLFKSI
jgi:type III pantothenate kinase